MSICYTLPDGSNIFLEEDRYAVTQTLFPSANSEQKGLSEAAYTTLFRDVSVILPFLVFLFILFSFILLYLFVLISCSCVIFHLSFSFVIFYLRFSVFSGIDFYSSSLILCSDMNLLITLFYLVISSK